MAPHKESIAEASLRITGLFESELLVELMLRFWEHPLANDLEYRSVLLETSVEALRASIGGSILFSDIGPQNVNLVAAVWYAEASLLPEADSQTKVENELRQAWLDKVRRALPSCFCNPDRLD